MKLTPTQKAKIKILEQISTIVGVDFWNVGKSDHSNDVRNVLLELAKDRLVRSGILSDYVLMDELLSELICRYFFDPTKTSIQLWRTAKFKTFNYHVLEELSLMKKVSLVKEIAYIPKKIEETIRLTNMLRNAVAHSFFPMNKRDFKRTKKVTYKGKDVFTIDGLNTFNEDTREAIRYLSEIAFGKPKSDEAKQP
jgi:hypothetical protein